MIYQFPAFQEGTCLTCCKWLRREAHGLIAFGTETWNSQELHKIYHMVLWIEACQIIIKLFYTISIFGLGKRMYHTNPRTPGHKRPKQNWRTYWAFSIDPPLLPHTQPRSEFRYHWASASLPGGIHEASILESFHLNWDLNSCEFRSIGTNSVLPYQKPRRPTNKSSHRSKLYNSHMSSWLAIELQLYTMMIYRYHCVTCKSILCRKIISTIVQPKWPSLVGLP